MGVTKSAGLHLMNTNGPLADQPSVRHVESHIWINAVCPSWVDTPMNHASLERVPQLGQIIKGISPLQRVANTEEVVDYIVFLCSPSGSYISGTSLTIDAGLSLTVHVG
ncbi:hypothetical protein LQW54_013517 [Pestalotiopsis sp. IQ-011]